MNNRPARSLLAIDKNQNLESAFLELQRRIRPQKRARRSLTPCNGLLFSLRPFENIFRLSGGLLYCWSNEKSCPRLVRGSQISNKSPFLSGLDTSWTRIFLCQYQNRGHRKTRRYPGTATTSRASHSKALNSTELSFETNNNMEAPKTQENIFSLLQGEA